jgi:hypothetical protein
MFADTSPNRALMAWVLTTACSTMKGMIGEGLGLALGLILALGETEREGEIDADGL